MTQARKDTYSRDGGKRSTATAVGGTIVKSRSTAKVKLARDKYQSDPQWINLKNGAAMKRAFISRDNE